MAFISFSFAVFFVLFFIVYWLIRRFDVRYQNALLLLGSYFFYGFWSIKFLGLLAGISVVNYLLGLAMGRSEARPVRKMWLLAGLFLNIGNLVLFKYFNFFIDEFVGLIATQGITISKISLTWVIPLGISFYTFLSVSYLVDVYRKNLEPERNPLNVMLSLSFFPIILSGPIQRPSMLLPQVKTSRVFRYEDMALGLRHILWGLFTKLVIADNLAPLVSATFLDPAAQDGSALLLGLLFYTVQIYADFSGYSDIAIGLARMLGFDIMRNFAFPYFATNIAEFWKRWHISLTTWFRDYLFLPVAYAVSGKIKKEHVLFIKSDYVIYSIGITVAWLVTGLWHGANLTFVVWGLIHGCFLIIYHIQKKPRKQLFKMLGIRHDNMVVVALESIVTMTVVIFAWIFFRATDVDQAFTMIGQIFSLSFGKLPRLLDKEIVNICLIILFFVMEWHGRADGFTLEKMWTTWPRVLRWGFYTLIICAIFLFAQTSASDFLYFKF